MKNTKVIVCLFALFAFGAASGIGITKSVQPSRAAQRSWSEQAWLASCSTGGTVRVRDARDGGFQYELRGHEGAVQALGFSSEGRWIATASGDGTVAVWHSATGGEPRRFTGVTSQFLRLAVHPSQPVLAFAQRDERVVHANVETGEVLLSVRPHTTVAGRRAF